MSDRLLRLPSSFREGLLSALADAPLQPLEDVTVTARGVYVLYPHAETFPLYALMADNWPVYVGKTEGSLRGRARDHRRSLAAAHNLDQDAFRVRVLPTDQRAFAVAAEAELQEHFRPLWNKETGPLQGVGNHGVGSTRTGQATTPWDTVHPGRPAQAQAAQTAAESLLLLAIDRLRATPASLTDPDDDRDPLEVVRACLPHRADVLEVRHQMTLGL